jgi:hypothetical protein
MHPMMHMCPGGYPGWEELRESRPTGGAAPALVRERLPLDAEAAGAVELDQTAETEQLR